MTEWTAPPVVPAARAILRTLSLALLPVLPLAACGLPAVPPTAPTAVARSGPAQAQQTYPVTVTDDAGRQVRVEREPRRIVSAAPSNTEILYALGLGERVAAVTTFCDYPAEAKEKPKIGGLRPNLEAIVAQQPDLVLGIRGTPADAVAALEGLGVPVLILNPADFEGVLANIRLVGRVAGAAGAADRMADGMRRRWDAVVERARTVPAQARPRVLYEVDATDQAAVTAAGPGTFIDAMIAAAGGVNVLAALTPGQQYPKVSAEVVLQADPQIIILGDAATGQSAATVSRRPGWDTVAAVRRGAIVGIADPNVTSRPGPRLVEGLDQIARAIHRDHFGAPLPAASPERSR